MLAQQILNGLVVGSVYALFALGFTLIFGVHHILNMAHGAVFMWGAFVGLFAVTRFDLPFPIAFILAVVLAGLLSVALDWVAFRPLRRRGAPEFSAMISSIGAGLILMNSGATPLRDARAALSVRHPAGRDLHAVRAAGNADLGRYRRQRARHRQRIAWLSVLYAIWAANPRRCRQ